MGELIPRFIGPPVKKPTFLVPPVVIDASVYRTRKRPCPNFNIGDCQSLFPLLEETWSGDRRFLDVKVDRMTRDLRTDSLLQSWNQTAATKGLCARVSFF